MCQLTIIKIHKDFQEKVGLGYLGKTARFWISFIYDTKLVLMLIFAFKTNSKKLFQKCNGEVANLFFTYNGQVTWFVSGECFDRQIFDWNNLNNEKLQELASNYSLAIMNVTDFETIFSKVPFIV